MCDSCKAAVFEEVGHKIELQKFELPDVIEDNAILCKTRFATICGSDIHTITGKRKEDAPLILGHEIIGEIVKKGKNVTVDGFGDSLAVGDRISWTIMASCNECFYCKIGLPQKCLSLVKYGHTSIHNKTKSPLLGGYGEYVYIVPGTTVFKVPDSLPDEIAAPANCALSTVMNAVETIGVEKDESVMVQGAGLLGLNACAILKEKGAKEIIIADVVDERLEQAKSFGATCAINTKNLSEQEIFDIIHKLKCTNGVDAAIEVCGFAGVVKTAINNLRIGGRYLIAGLVTPGSNTDIDGNTLTRKCLTVKGIHNYRPEHLGKSLKFLEQNYKKYPFDDIVKVKFPLKDINEAVEAAKSGKYIRVGVFY